MWATQSVVQAVVESVDNSLELSIRIHDCGISTAQYFLLLYWFGFGSCTTNLFKKEFAVLGCLWENNAIGVYQGNDPIPPVAPFSGVFQIESVPLAPCYRPTR